MMKKTWQVDIDPGVFVFLLLFSFHQCLSNKNDIGGYAFDLEHLFQNGFLMACLNAHSATSRNINRLWKCILHLHRQVLEKELNFRWEFLKSKDDVNIGLWLYCLSKHRPL